MTASDHGGMHLDGSSDKTYVTGPIAMNWMDARAYCVANFDDLASIHSAEDQALAYAACQAAGHSCWIGSVVLIFAPVSRAHFPLTSVVLVLVLLQAERPVPRRSLHVDGWDYG